MSINVLYTVHATAVPVQRRTREAVEFRSPGNRYPR
jgi:hypothetical protein